MRILNTRVALLVMALVGATVVPVEAALSSPPAGAVTRECPTGDMPFNDVSTNSFAYDSIICIFELGITTGTNGGTTYSPKDFVTREEMAAFIARFYRVVNGADAPIVTTPFTDVSPTSFARDHIARIFGLDITTGTGDGTTYSPDDLVTRGQMAAFLARLQSELEGFCATPVTPFDDIVAGKFYTDPVACIYGLEVTTGTNGGTTYSPDDFVTREQMAAFLARLYEKTDQGSVIYVPPDPGDPGDPDDPVVVPGPVECSLRTSYIDITNVFAAEHLAVWWGPGGGDLAPTAQLVAEDMENSWTAAVDDLGLEPPAGSTEYCTNIYILDTGGSLATQSAGFGTDANGVPFVNLPLVVAADFLVTPPGPDSSSAYGIHEVMHLYQIGSEFDGIDSRWFEEATPEWFVDYVYPTDTFGKETSAAFLINPQLPLWALASTQGVPVGDLSWSRQNHNYGAQMFLIWLTDELGVDLIADALTAPASSLTVQEWLFDEIASRGHDMGALYLDFAAHAATIDLPRNAAAVQAWFDVWSVDAGNAGDVNLPTATWASAGTGGLQRPPVGLEPAAWAFNAIRVDAASTGTYTVTLIPDAMGSSSLTPSELTGQLVRQRAGDRTYAYFTGTTATMDVVSGDELWVVVASTPDLFTGSETFGYQYSVALS